MSKSNLTAATYAASTNNYTKGRAGYKICKFTPHHMAGVLTAKRCGELFQNPSRGGSSNYGIGNDGTIACYVEEENRAWTSSSPLNDYQAITVEVSNCENGGQWKISDAAWNSLVNLAVDVCRRYNFRLVFDGTPKGSLTMHKMFASTSCPGPYLESRMPELAKTVNAILDGTDIRNENNKVNGQDIECSLGYIVTINTNLLNVRSGPGTNYKINTSVRVGEKYTIVEENNGWGKLKSGAGWICLAYTSKGSLATANVNKYSKGTYKVIADLLNVRSGPGTNYSIKNYSQLTSNAQAQNKNLGNGKANGLLKNCICGVSETQGNWGKIPSGWICLDYCKKQ